MNGQRHDPTIKLEHAALLGLFACVLAVMIAWFGRPVALLGVTLDDRLAVVDRTGLAPEVPLEAGDLVEAVDGNEVSTLAELDALLGVTLRKSGVRVRVLQAPRQKTWTVRAGGVVDLVPELFAPNVSVVRVGDAPAPPNLTAELLETLVAEGSGEVAGVARREGHRVEGTLPLTRGRPSLLSVLWAALIAIVGAAFVATLPGSAVRGARRLLAAPWLMGVAGAGAGALAVMHASGPASRLILWALALGLVHRTAGLALARTAGDTRFSGAFPWVAFAVATSSVVLASFTTAASLSATGGLGWIESARHAALALLLCLAAIRGADAIERWSRVGTPPGARLWAVVAAGLDAAAVLVMLFSPSRPDLFGASLFCATAAGAVADAWAFRARSGKVGTELLLPWLSKLTTELSPAASPAVVLCPARLVVSVTAVDAMGDGNWSLRAEVIQGPLADAVSILRGEGRAWDLTTAGAETPAVLDALREAGLVAALPFETEGTLSVQAFVIAVSRQPELAEGVTVASLRSSLEDLSRELAYAELLAATTAAVAGSSRSRRDAEAAAEETTTTSRTVRLQQAVKPGRDPRATALRRYLDAREGLRHPVEEPWLWSEREERLIKTLAGDDRPWLVCGEPGTGKELLARCVHARSRRAAELFAVVDAATLPDGVLALTLFGEDGQSGVASLVGEGTLLLKGLSRLNPTLQEAVLRRLDRLAARVVLAERFDGDRDEALAAIPPMARAFVQERCGYLPPLRDRGEDVERLATGFMLRHAMLCGRPAKACSVEARHALRHRYWTGNVPELEQVVRVAVLRAGARVEAADLPASG